MGLLDAAVAGRNAILNTIGSTGLHLEFPDEFEIYVCAFELVDKNLNTLQYFIFPINPSSISETRPEITNIKKTSGGVTVLSNPTFIPTDISLNGNFGGKKFKFLMGETYQSLISTFQTDSGYSSGSIARGIQNVFNENIKTGYGCIKILEKILDGLKIVDNLSPRKLIFYNLALNHSYFVNPLSSSFNQSQESNMIWNYSITLKSIMPVESIVASSSEKLKSNTQLTVDGAVQKSVQGVLNSINSLI